jgi:hypothetical protein
MYQEKSGNTVSDGSDRKRQPSLTAQSTPKRPKLANPAEPKLRPRTPLQTIDAFFSPSPLNRHQGPILRKLFRP